MKRSTSTAFTLVEMVLALVMCSLIFAAVGSSVLAVTRALPNKSSTVEVSAAGARVVSAMAIELRHALSVTERTASAITFTVADRNNDGQPETIRYAWSGVAGAGLTRQYNGGAAATVLSDVREFLVASDVRSQSVTTPDTEGAETTLFSYDNILNLLLATDQRVQSSTWVGQYFKPTLPANATAWKVTRVMYRARTHGGANGETYVQLRRAAGYYPSRSVAAQVSMLESTLTSSYQWIQTVFAGASFGINDGACLLFQWVSDSDSCDIQLGTLSSVLAGNALCVTGNETATAASWSGDSLKAVQCYIYGTITTSSPNTTKYYLTNVRLRLRAGSESAAGVEENVRLLAEPEVSGP